MKSQNTIARSSASFFALAMALGTTAINGAEIEVEVEAIGPVSLSPLFINFHDGSFDAFNTSEPASAALETLAELGDTAPLEASTAAANQSGAVGDSMIPSGSTARATFQIDRANTDFSFVSMVLPSNDWFIGNNDPEDIRSVVRNGGESATIVISRIYDAGTEEEDFAFSAGNPTVGLPDGDAAGGTSTPDKTITRVRGSDTPFADFDGIPSGFDISSLALAEGTPIARITITNKDEASGGDDDGTTTGTVTSILPDAVDLGQDWYFSEASGIFYGGSFPWVYSDDLGWRYLQEGTPGYYFYRDSSSSWAWSDAGVWPFYYDFTAGDFLSAE